jgi:3-deoxy-D-manno-octulosonate 8-phosphate phosphatase (KDO 8-P phosphatase)
MRFASPDAPERARRVKLMIFDVDGVLTDGRLYFGPRGEEMKVFHALDGHGLRMLADSGVQLALLSGRRSEAVALRAAELRIAHVLQGVEAKRGRYESLLAELGVAAQDSGYMGDELVDLPVLTRCGFACTVSEAPESVRERAHYVAGDPAGAGAAREVCEYVMRAQGSLARALESYFA